LGHHKVLTSCNAQYTAASRLGDLSKEIKAEKQGKMELETLQGRGVQVAAKTDGSLLWATSDAKATARGAGGEARAGVVQQCAAESGDS
jgi:hypothetical protein